MKGFRNLLITLWIVLLNNCAIEEQTNLRLKPIESSYPDSKHSNSSTNPTTRENDADPVELDIGILALDFSECSATAPLELDTTSSNISVISSSEFSGSPEGSFVCQFTIAETAIYKIQGLVKSSDSSSDSMFFSIDNLEMHVWHFFPDGKILPGLSWVWLSAQGTGSPANPELSPFEIVLERGEHQISFHGREKNAKLAGIKIVRGDSQDKLPPPNEKSPVIKVPPEDNSPKFYISPAGTDSNPGTYQQPWKSFQHAIPKLEPGQTLVLMDGIYLEPTTGLPYIDCAGAAKSGSESLPITLRAENDRKAYLKANGSTAALEIKNCTHWILHGLRGSSADLVTGGSSHDVFLMRNIENIALRGLLATHNNRYTNSHLYGLINSKNILFEECEGYYFHRHAFSIWKSRNVVIRRSYVHSRGYADILGSFPSGVKNAGDEAFAFYQSSFSIIENSISEKSLGFQIHGGKTYDGRQGGSYNKILGSISLGDLNGAKIDSRSNGISADNLYKDFIVVNPSSVGIYARSASDLRLENVTVLGSTTHSGFIADGGGGLPCTTVDCTFSVLNSLFINNSSYGLYANAQNLWSVEYSNGFGNGTNFAPGETISDSSGYITRSLSRSANGIGTGVNQCIVYIPEGSSMKRAGKDGADIGATVLNRYENGVLTDKPLWHPVTGSFPCGAIIQGVNDSPGQSCLNVHERLNVNYGGCQLPTGYGVTSN